MSKSVFSSNPTRSLMFLVLGATIVLLFLVIYLYFFPNGRTEVHKQTITESFNVSVVKDTTLKFNDKMNFIEVDSSYLASLLQLKSDLNNEFLRISAKLESIDTRFSDLYTLGSVIIGLIVAIIAGTVISGRTAVRNYLEENESTIKNNLEKHLKYASKMVGDIEVELKIANQFKSAQQYKGADKNTNLYNPQQDDGKDSIKDSKE